MLGLNKDTIMILQFIKNLIHRYQEYHTMRTVHGVKIHIDRYGGLMVDEKELFQNPHFRAKLQEMIDADLTGISGR